MAVSALAIAPKHSAAGQAVVAGALLAVAALDAAVAATLPALLAADDLDLAYQVTAVAVDDATLASALPPLLAYLATADVDAARAVAGGVVADAVLAPGVSTHLAAATALPGVVGPATSPPVGPLPRWPQGTNVLPLFLPSAGSAVSARFHLSRPSRRTP